MRSARGTALYLPTPKAKPARSEAAALVGTQINRLRQAAGISPLELTQRSGVSRSMLSRLFAEQRCRTDFSHVPSSKGLRVERLGAVARLDWPVLAYLRDPEVA